MKWKRCLLAALWLGVCIALGSCIRTEDEQKWIAEEMELDLPENLEGTITDDHDNFHGDGVTAARWELSDEDYEDILGQVQAAEHWNSLPLPGEPELLLYGGTRHGVEYAYNLADHADIPVIENGYYLFVDNYDGRHREVGYENLLDRFSFNIVYGVLDTEQRILYFMKYDS